MPETRINTGFRHFSPLFKLNRPIVGCAFGIFAGDSKAIDENGASINGGYNPLVSWYDYPEPAAAEKTGQQAYDAIQGVVDQLNKAGVSVTMPE